jgi:hypothetical protein
MVLLAWVAFAVLCTAASARADEDPTELAGREYTRGNELARATRWAEALQAFEVSYGARPHALTLYNIGVCERVLGRSTRARERFELAMGRASADQRELPASIREEIDGFLREYQRIIPRVRVTLDPKDAGIAVDGRPLRLRKEEGHVVLEAGVETPGMGTPPPAATFELDVDPGTHVITITRQGYRDVVQTRDFPPGDRSEWQLALSRLPAVLHVSAQQLGAQVRVNGVDVGVTPVDITRPAGTYRVIVQKPGFVQFTNDVTLRAGEETDLKATLPEEKIPITRRWWFWAGAAGVLAVATTVTYFATRPTPPPQPYDGGSSGWVVFP